MPDSIPSTNLPTTSQPMPKILIADPLDPYGLELLTKAGAEIRVVARDERGRLAELIADVDALVVRSATQVTAELMQAGKNLKAVGRAGVGVDNVDVGAAAELGIPVVNAPTANLTSATEHTLALLLALARQVPAADASMKRGEWDRTSFLGTELDGKTLGVVGFGRIGQRVAERAKSFGMSIVAADPYGDAEVARRLGVELVSIDELIARADAITLHTPLIEATRNVISRERIAAMKPGTLLVNCARGGLIDDQALLEALDAGTIGGAAFDVYEKEPPVDRRLAEHPRVVATPHIGAQTREAQRRISEEMAHRLLPLLGLKVPASASMAATAPMAAGPTPNTATGKLRVGVIFGGRSVEHQVSLRSARTVVQGLEEAGYTPVPLAIAEDGCWLSPERSAAILLDGALAVPPEGKSVASTLGALTGASVDALFPIVHGTWGEDGTLQGLCEMLDLPYVGPGVATSALAMDKRLAKRQLRAAGVPVVDDETTDRAGFERDREEIVRRASRFPYPLFVKPSVGGSSVGVAKVERPEDLAAAVELALRFDEAVLVERGVRGRELECAVLGGAGRIEASGVGEIVPGNAFYDYADKYLQDTARLIAPAEISREVEERLRSIAVAAFDALGGSGMARVDFFLEGEDLYVNEINTLPGFTSISMYPRLWGLSGLPLPKLVGRLVEIAIERHAERRRLDAGIKQFLGELAAASS